MSKKKREQSLTLSQEDINKQAKDMIANIVMSDVKIQAKNESQKELIKLIKEKEITICAGPPGCGKTIVSLGMALSLLKNEDNNYRKIYLIKSVTTLKGEEVGFLKGDLSEKIEPFMWSFILNVDKLVSGHEIKSLFDSDIIRPFPLAYIRGTTLDNAIVVIDEAQNITIDNARTILTRIGQNCKMILLGDTNQIDLKNRDESSLDVLMKMFEGSDKIGVLKMSSSDASIRNPIINHIEEKYNNYFQELENEGKSVERKVLNG